jgi:hypothetical protein
MDGQGVYYFVRNGGRSEMVRAHHVLLEATLTATCLPNTHTISFILTASEGSEKKYDGERFVRNEGREK